MVGESIHARHCVQQETHDSLAAFNQVRSGQNAWDAWISSFLWEFFLFDMMVISYLLGSSCFILPTCFFFPINDEPILHSPICIIG